MPLAAFALKENLGGAVASKTCDNEHSTASLGDSEVSSVQSSPRHAIPELLHFIEKPSEVSAVVGTEETWDILQHDPPRSSLLHKVKESEGEAGSLACESCSLACDAEVLARKSTTLDVCFWDCICFHLRDASQIRSVWESLCQHRASVWFNLADTHRVDASALKAEIKTADAAEKACVPHLPSFLRSFLANPSPL
jgi:hypothetical protein